MAIRLDDDRSAGRPLVSTMSFPRQRGGPRSDRIGGSRRERQFRSGRASFVVANPHLDFAGRVKQRAASSEAPIVINGSRKMQRNRVMPKGIGSSMFWGGNQAGRADEVGVEAGRCDQHEDRNDAVPEEPRKHRSHQRADRAERAGTRIPGPTCSPGTLAASGREAPRRVRRRRRRLPAATTGRSSGRARPPPGSSAPRRSAHRKPGSSSGSSWFSSGLESVNQRLPGRDRPTPSAVCQRSSAALRRVRAVWRNSGMSISRR